MATIKDVAQLAKVSVATVSRVINHKANVSQASQLAVQEAMQRLNYYPDANARALSQQASHTIGLVVADVSDPFFGTMVSAIERVASETDHFLLIGNGYHQAEQERKAIRQMIEHRCSALIVHAKRVSDQELTELMQQVPGMVLINRLLDGFAERCIALDDCYGAYLAVRHLLQQGHRQIAYLCSNHPISDAADRLQGYRQALAERQLPFNELMVIFAPPTESGGEEAMMKLLERHTSITAVACYNDAMAAGALSVLHDNDFAIPADMSIIGFDDLPLASYLYPKLTTMRYPLTRMAEQAARLSLALSGQAPLYSQTINLFVPTLIKRYSVKKIDTTSP